MARSTPSGKKTWDTNLQVALEDFTLNESVCRLFDMQGEFDVYPGHERKTSLDFERANNRLVRWKNR